MTDPYERPTKIAQSILEKSREHFTGKVAPQEDWTGFEKLYRESLIQLNILQREVRNLKGEIGELKDKLKDKT